MIYFFTGTGNSKHVASAIGKIVNEDIISINSGERVVIDSEKPTIIVSPTHGWRLPEIMENFLSVAEFKDNKDVYFVLTCGNDIGNAPVYAKKLCEKLNLNYRGTAEILMPENYIVLFKAPNIEECSKIVKKADTVVETVANTILENEDLVPPSYPVKGFFESTVANPLFRRFIIKSDKFCVTGDCIGCSRCADECPVNAIIITENGPTWNNNCIHCMSCISGCPQVGIEYGKKTVGKRRYVFIED